MSVKANHTAQKGSPQQEARFVGRVRNKNGRVDELHGLLKDLSSILDPYSVEKAPCDVGEECPDIARSNEESTMDFAIDELGESINGCISKVEYIIESFEG